MPKIKFFGIFNSLWIVIKLILNVLLLLVEWWTIERLFESESDEEEDE